MKPETALQINIVNRLSELCAREREKGNHFFFFSVPNEGFMQSATVLPKEFLGAMTARQTIQAMLTALKKMGMTPGVPDLCIVHDGRAYFIEVKTPKGQLSKAQVVVHGRIATCGCNMSVCRSIGDLEFLLRIWGIV